MNTMMVRHIFSVSTGSTPSSGEEGYWDGPVQWATPEDLGALDQPYLHETRRTLTEDGYAASGAVIVPSGSLVLTKRAPIGRVAILATDACANQGCLLLNPKQGIDSRYYYYWLRCQSEHLNSLGRGSTFMELSTDDLKSLRAPYPSPETQRAIADFLDTETARIDALITAKENLLAILAEKRRALITQAVTRGLDPSVPLRESGIPWLGEIPAHWKSVRLKHVATVQSGLALGKKYPKSEQIESYPYLRVANVQDGYVDLSEVKMVEVSVRDAAGCRLRAGDVLMNEGGDADKLGRGAIWSGEIDPCLHQNHVFAVRPQGVSQKWLNLWTSSEGAKAFFESRAKQSTNLASISATNLKELPLPLPPQAEQLQTVAHVASELAKLDAFEGAATTTIALLRERREALIAAAVTGQLDVETA